MTIFPALNWYVGHKIEYIALIAYFFFMFLYAFSMLDGKVSKWLYRAGMVFFIGSMAVYAIFPSTVYTQYTKTMRELLTAYIVIGAIFLWATVIRRKELRKPEHLLAVASIVIMAAAWLIEQRGYMGDMTIAVPLATLLFAFIGAISLTIGFARTERQLDLAMQQERKLVERNKLMDSLNRMKSDFMANIGHEIKTPLTVISGFAQQTRKEIMSDRTNEETSDNLMLISTEAQRLATLADQMLYSLKNQRTGIDLAPTEPERMLEHAALLCGPILERNGNRITILSHDCPLVTANADMIVQVLSNLCLNASRHSKNDEVLLDAKAAEAGYAAFTVRDHGDGIPAELMPHVFERGVSGDNESGLGLSICRDIIESHGGSIQIESDSGNTTVTFTLPLADREKGPE
jgi:signal transduction histidine kinase